MSKLKLDISMSLDGFTAGPNQSKENPLGEGGEQLHDWVVGLEAWRKPHGYEGGEVNASTPVMEESLENIGATVMGRNMFGGEGQWGDEPWDGWWGDDPPVPHAGLHRHPPRPRAGRQGGWHHLHLRHRRGRVRPRAGPGSGRRQGRRASPAVRTSSSST